MAVTNKNSEQFVLELYKGEHDLETNSLKFILMNDTFVFNPATHSNYAAISASEIATGNGYTVKDKAVVVTGIAITNNVIVVSCESPVWTATDGAIPAVAACCVINDSHANDTVVCCCEFGASYSTAQDKQFQINYSNGLTKGTPNPA